MDSRDGDAADAAPPPSRGEMGGRRTGLAIGRESIGLALLFSVAFAVRLPGIWQDLPFVFHYDEPTLVNLAVWIFTEGSLNPRYFNYPAGMIYLIAALFALVLVFGRALGAFPGFAEGLRRLSSGTYPRPPGGEIIYRFPTKGVSALYIAGRLASALLGTLTVLWCHRLGRALGGARVAWLAAALLALNALHAVNSALVTTDVACAAFLAWFLACLFTGASPRRTGIALGLSAAFKYTGGIGLYLWPLGLLLPPAGVSRREWSFRWLRLLPWAAGVFLVLNPFIALTPGGFLEGFRREAEHMGAGTAHFGEGIALGAAGPSVLLSMLWLDLGALPLSGFVLATILAVVRRRRDARARAALLLCAWCWLYLVQLATWKTAYARYLLPIWPALLVLAACGWDRLVAWLERASLPWLRSAPASTALLAVAAVPGLLPLGRSIEERLRTDPRVEMSRVIERSLAADEAIAAEPGAPWIDPVSRQVIKVDVLGRARPEVWRRRGVRYLIATGRETYLPAGSPDSLLENRRRIEQAARTVWREGPYVIFDLGEGEDAFNRARRLLAAGRAGEARRTLEELCRVDSTNSPAVMLLGDARLAQGDTTAAVDAYLLASRLDESDPVPFLAMGSIALESRRWDAAVAAFLQARTLSPRDPIPVHNLSTAFLYRAEASILAGRKAAAARDLVDAALLARLGTSIVPEEARFRQLEAKTRELSVRWGIPLPEAP